MVLTNESTVHDRMRGCSSKLYVHVALKTVFGSWLVNFALKIKTAEIESIHKTCLLCAKSILKRAWKGCQERTEMSCWHPTHNALQYNIPVYTTFTLKSKCK